MSARFVNLDRQTPMFLRCDLREWIPEGHIVHVILEAVEQLPPARFHINHRGTGSEQYPPDMMLALLIYCYATGRFGSHFMKPRYVTLVLLASSTLLFASLVTPYNNSKQPLMSLPDAYCHAMITLGADTNYYHCVSATESTLTSTGGRSAGLRVERLF